MPDASGTAYMSLGESPEEVPDASGIANFTLGDHPTVAPDIYGDAIYSADFSRIGDAPTKYGTIVYEEASGGSKLNGTMLSPAHSDGTAYNVLNMTPARSNGKVALPSNERALVNESGTESIVRDGVWSLLPGGAHIANLKKGDIIFNAEQTKSLLSFGKISGHARAYADGTLSAYGTGTAWLGFGGGLAGSGREPVHSPLGSGQQAADAVSDAVSSVSKAAESAAEEATEKVLMQSKFLLTGLNVR